MWDHLKFRHGVHPPELKELTARIAIRRVPYPDEVVLPLRQHGGKPARLVVRPGDVETARALLADARRAADIA